MDKKEVKKILNYIKKKCEKIINNHSINKNENIIINKKINMLENNINCLNIDCLYDDKSNENVEYLNPDINELDSEFMNFIELLSLYYEKYNMENIIKINIENIVGKYILSSISPLRLYDAKENTIIYGYEYTKNKPYVTISHRWNNYCITCNECNSGTNCDDCKNCNNCNIKECTWKIVDKEVNYKLKQIKDIYEKSKEKIRYYWMDTISINQDDVKEKEKEIKNMSNYYKYSLMTIVLTNTSLNKYKQNFLNLVITFFSEFLNENNFNDYYDEILLELLNIIIKNTYFKDYWDKRVWTFQETILNKNIFIYENNFLSLNLLSNIMDIIDIDRFIDGNLYGSLERVCLLFKCNKYIYNVGEIIKITNDRECTLPHDRIFSILSFIDSRINIPIDYSMKIEDIYIKLFKESIKINDSTFLSLILNDDPKLITILPKHINFKDNNLYLNSYTIKKEFSELEVLLYNQKYKYFFKKWFDINNNIYNKKIKCLIKYIYNNNDDKILQFINDLNLNKYFMEDFSTYNFKIFNIGKENIGIIQTIYKINIKEVFKQIGRGTEFILSYINNLPYGWCNYILIQDNMFIGYGIININKSHCIEKNVAIDFNIYDLLKI